MNTKKNYMRPVTTVLFYETESLLQALSDKNNSKGDDMSSGGVEGGGGTTTVTPSKSHDSSYDLWDDEEEDYD